MKKYLIIILGVAFFACTQQKGYKINVNLEGAEGKILLEKRGSSAWIPVDTADVVEGVAVLEGEVEIPGDYYISVVGQRNKAIIFVENSAINVTGKVDSIYLADIAGSATHDEYLTVNNKLKELGESMQSVSQQYREARAANDEEKMTELEPKFERYYEDVEAIQVGFIKENPASYVTPFYLNRIRHGKEADELEVLVNNLDPKLDSIPSVIELKKHIEKLKTVAIGQIAPDFTQNDPDGNPIKLSDIYSNNELTLIDFWAAWCGPCRGENPNVVAVFNDYKDKGFTVFGVSLDREKDAWLKAIEDDNLTWTHVSDLSYWQNAAAQLYAVNSIPHSLLVDKTGKIIAKDKREDELREVVAKFFESKP